jgi:ethanolamine utilization protein EutP (predicted NTPase)
VETPNSPMQDLLARERVAVAGLVQSLKRFGATPEDVEHVEGALQRVTGHSFIVVAGEFDSGKSAFIDALVGVGPGVRDVAPATGWVTLLKHGVETTEREVARGISEKTLPVPFLQNTTVADTPVTNAILRRDPGPSLEFAARADVILFITSSEHTLTESGREFLRLLRDVAGKVVLIVNKVDLLPSAEDIERVRWVVEAGSAEALGRVPPILFVSSFLGSKAGAAANVIERWALWRKSGFADLEERVLASLGGSEGVEVAMQASLGVAQKLGIRYRFALDERIGLLDEDLKTYVAAGSQLEAYRAGMRRDYEARAAQVENIVSWMNNRASEWFDGNIRLANVAGLARSERARGDFEREVVIPTEARVQAWIDDLARWMVRCNGERWRSLVEYISKRRRMDYVERLMGSLDDLISSQDYPAKAEDDAVEGLAGEDAVGLVRDGNPDRELAGISASLRSAVTRTAAAEVGALGMGGAAAASVTLAATLAVPLTLGTVLLAVFGLYGLPGCHRNAHDEFRARTASLRERLGEVVRQQFEAEIDASVGRMHAAMTTHVRFLLAEKERVTRIRASLDAVDAELEEIKASMEALYWESGEPPATSHRTAV